MPRQHPEPGEPEVQSREDLIRTVERTSNMLDQAGQSLASVRSALLIANGALGEADKFLDSMGYIAPEDFAERVGVIKQIVEHAKDASNAALG